MFAIINIGYLYRYTFYKRNWVKVLHVIYTHGVSGAEKHLDYLLPGLLEYGINCEVLFICPPSSKTVLSDFGVLLQQKGIKTTVIPATRNMLFSTLRKINNYLKQNGISIVHSHLLNTDILVSLVKQFFNPRLFIISTKHGYNEVVLTKYASGNGKIRKNAYYHITRYTLKKIDRNIAISKGMSEMFRELNITKDDYPVLHHGIDVKVGDAAADDTAFRKASPQLIIAGRLETIKGHEYVLNAMPAILEKYPACKLLVLGEGSLKNKLISQAAELGISGSVEFLGFKNNPYSYISNSDVIILPSLFEPFGLIYIEAHSLKVPVVAFDAPAANELMQNDYTGLLAPKFDSAALAEKVLLLLNDPAKREFIVNNAYNQYLARYTTATMVKNIAAFYFDLFKK